MGRRKKTDIVDPMQEKLRKHPKFTIAKDPDFLALTHYQQRFVYNVFMQPITGWTNAKCYREAYGEENIQNENRSASTDSINYYQTVRNKKIEPLIKKLQLQYAKSLDVTPMRILQEESCIAFSDLAEYFDAEGRLTIHPNMLPEKARRAIKSIRAIRQKNGNVVYELTLWSKSASLSRLQNVLGMNTAKKLEISGPDGGPIQISHKYDFTLLNIDEKRLLAQLLSKCKIENMNEEMKAIPYKPINDQDVIDI